MKNQKLLFFTTKIIKIMLYKPKPIPMCVIWSRFFFKSLFTSSSFTNTLELILCFGACKLKMWFFYYSKICPYANLSFTV